MQLAAESELGKEPHLPARPISLATLRRFEHLIEAIQLPQPRSELVARSRLDERLNHALVRALQVKAIAEVVQRPERIPRSASLDDRLGGAFADVLDGTEAEADALRREREVELRLVHVRRQHREAHPAAFGHR